MPKRKQQDAPSRAVPIPRGKRRVTPSSTDGPQQNVDVTADSPTLHEPYPLQQASSTFYNSAPTMALSREQLNEVTQAVVAVLSQRMESSNPLVVQEAQTDSDQSGTDLSTIVATPNNSQVQSYQNELGQSEHLFPGLKYFVCF
ncbi:uncharacterized protein LOC130047321 [Ostrea edulis]|uniref:uncharacterized protein LOC130047321 n=1 Tax=Ostrea edulis TaxID=37623 RepID=UPI0024AF7E27|nr:uncharacterized protein LOC130047321 [Ostrea edulis]